MDPILETLAEVTSAFADSQKQTNARLLEIEQKMSRRFGGGGGDQDEKSWGAQVIASPDLKSIIGNGQRSTVRVGIETKAITNLGSGVAADRRPEIVGLPKRRLVVRDLLPVTQTASNAVEFVRETARSIGAAPVAEGALKPESDITFEVVTTPVRTIATWLHASRQSLDDLPQLRAFVDTELRYAIGYVEEVQILTGDGLGQNLTGLIPAATAYQTTRNVAGDLRTDVIHHAIAQLADGGLTATGVILNLADYSRMLEQKDANGAYLSEGPFGTVPEPRLWGVPVAATPAMAAGSFLVGDFPMAAQLFDRMEPEVLVSTEDRDNFIRNMITVRAEERLALAIKRPSALVYGTFGTITA